jgi:MYXO-CTERM domain-containing protein
MPSLACVTDACDGTGGCARSINAGSCVIADTCVTDQDANPAEACQLCDATADQADWTDQADGTSCGTDVCNAAGTGVTSQGCTAGTCMAQPDADCGAYLCDASTNACFAACTDGSECEMGAECAGGVCVTERPSAEITAPSEAVCGETIMLSGSASTDPNMLALTYEWSQTLGEPNLLDNVDTTQETLSVTIPDVLDTGVVYRFQLLVNNGGFDSDPVATDITVMACPAMMDDSSMEPEPDMGPDMDAGPTPDMDAGPSSDMDSGPAPDAGTDSGPAPDGGADAGADSGTEAGSRAFLQGGACASAPTHEPPSAWLLVCLLGLLISRRRRSIR